jgi:hypothetical protein
MLKLSLWEILQKQLCLFIYFSSLTKMGTKVTLFLPQNGILLFKIRFLEMLPFAGKWMELENIILSEVSLAQKTKNRMFSLICGH